MSIGVYHTIESASLYFKRAVSHLSLRPKVENNTIGSEFVMTGIGGTGGAVIMRERNICISFGWRGETEATKKTTIMILELLQKSRTVAPLGVFSNPIRLQNSKASVTTDENSDGLFTLPAEFTAGADSEQLLLGASSRSERFYAVSRDLDDGSIMIDARGKSKSETIELYIATENNVITCESITLEATKDIP
jgi:hypothetical protein